MRKQELSDHLTDELLNKLYGFCYARTNDSYEAQDLCSDIVYTLIKASRSEGDIENSSSYIWTDIRQNRLQGICIPVKQQ